MRRWQLPKVHWPFAVTMILLAGLGANNVQEALTDWHLHDMEVYRAAASRLLANQPLYGGDVTTFDAYRYAPWWAYAWIPLTLLPESVVNVGWSIVMLGASGACLWMMRGRDMAHVAAMALFGPILFGISAIGNVQPLMIAALMVSLPTAWGWIVVGLAGSLKVVPLAYCAVFIVQRRWRAVIGATALAAALWMPVASMPVDSVTWDAGPTSTLPIALWAPIALMAAAGTLVLAWRRSAWTGLASGTAAILALPRFFLYEVLLLLPATTVRLPHSGHTASSTGAQSPAASTPTDSSSAYMSPSGPPTSPRSPG